MNKTQLQYIITRTYNELVLNMVFFLDFIMPDLTVLSVIRKYIRGAVISVGKYTRIRKGQYCTHIRQLSIGSGCFINRGNIFDNSEKISIGNNCSIGYKNTFITSSHYEKGQHKENETLTTISTPILIGNNVWITSNCTILPGSVIEDNVIVAAGSVVKGVLHAGSIYGGVPAKLIRKSEGFVSKKG